MEIPKEVLAQLHNGKIPLGQGFFLQLKLNSPSIEVEDESMSVDLVLKELLAGTNKSIKVMITGEFTLCREPLFGEGI